MCNSDRVGYRSLPSLYVSAYLSMHPFATRSPVAGSLLVVIQRLLTCSGRGGVLALDFHAEYHLTLNDWQSSPIREVREAINAPPVLSIMGVRSTLNAVTPKSH